MIKKIRLSNNVMVSDPCYQIPTWCQSELTNVLPGTFLTTVKRHNDLQWGDRCDVIIAIHEDFINRKDILWEIENTIAVDSGQAGIFDKPSYRNDHDVLHIPFIKGESPFSYGYNTDEDGEKWYEKMCDLTLTTDGGWGIYPNGVVSSSGYGDGTYPLHIARESNGYIVGMVIDFGVSEDEFDFDFMSNLEIEN